MTNSKDDRLEVLKTYKIYIGGAFPRTESGRFYSPTVQGRPLGNVCLCSRKDLRNAVVAARGAQPGWSGRTAYNRGQILYRIAEMLEGRSVQFVEELIAQGSEKANAQAEVDQAIDRLIYYAGWCDKYQQVFSSVNPVASSHFNFSMLEPTGVVFVVADEDTALLGLISLVAPVIAAGNTCIVLASESKPLSSVTFSEVIHSSDVPAGVFNVLTGSLDELAEHFARHKDINAIAFDRRLPDTLKLIQQGAVENVKRVKAYDRPWSGSDGQDPYLIEDFCELKTTWHPIEKISASGSGY